MKRGILLLMVSLGACTVQNSGKKSADGIEETQLDFQDCNFESNRQFIKLQVPSGYSLRKVSDHGFCEYWFSYKDKSVFYVTSNVTSGSSLNYENRLNNGILTYSNNRSKNDTIRNQGVETDEEYWSEWINGAYTVGYINSPDSIKFAKSLESIRFVENP